MAIEAPPLENLLVALPGSSSPTRTEEKSDFGAGENAGGPPKPRTFGDHVNTINAEVSALWLWLQGRPAMASRVTLSSLADSESGANQTHCRALAVIWRDLDDTSITFIDENVGGVGVRLREPGDG